MWPGFLSKWPNLFLLLLTLVLFNVSEKFGRKQKNLRFMQIKTKSQVESRVQ